MEESALFKPEAQRTAGLEAAGPDEPGDGRVFEPVYIERKR